MKKISRNDMKKIILSLSLLLLFSIPSAYAHPGSTDSSGGHNNQSTGEYHYHHGYSAHQHYDIDGDGKDDCPYNFKDKTGSSSGTSTNSRFSGNSNKTTVVNSSSEKQNPSFWQSFFHVIGNIFYVIFRLLIFAFICLIVVEFLFYLSSHFLD